MFLYSIFCVPHIRLLAIVIPQGGLLVRKATFRVIHLLEMSKLRITIMTEDCVKDEQNAEFSGKCQPIKRERELMTETSQTTRALSLSKISHITNAARVLFHK